MLACETLKTDAEAGDCAQAFEEDEKAHSEACPLKKNLKCKKPKKTAFWHIASHEGHGKAALWFAKIRGEAHLKEISSLKWLYTYRG